MRIILLFLILSLLSLNVNAQDWELFPYQQKMFYAGPDGDHGQFVDIYHADSIKVDSQGKQVYFRKNLPLNEKVGDCLQEAIEESYGVGSYADSFHYVGALEVKNGVVRYYSDKSNNPFFFRPNASVGDSWTIESTYGGNKYSKITIKCKNIGVESFLGLTDSVKTFSLFAINANLQEVPITNSRIKLSKHYGLIEFMPFHMFLVHPKNFYSVKLIGIDSSGTEYGYQQPQFEDYFHLSTGDILFWNKHVYSSSWLNPAYDEYFRDSITDVSIDSERVIYTFNRITLNKNKKIFYASDLEWKFKKSQLKHLLEAPPNWLGFGYEERVHGSPPVWNTESLLIDNDSVSGRQYSTYSFQYDGTSLDTSDCSVERTADIHSSYKFNTYAGLVENCYGNWGITCVRLTGSRIDDRLKGSIKFTSIQESDRPHSLTVYPNPVSNNLIIEGNIAIPATYRILKVTGQVVDNGTLPGSSFDISHLNSGIYFIVVEGDDVLYRGRFVKR